jgi:hypothetical protein
VLFGSFVDPSANAPIYAPKNIPQAFNSIFISISSPDKSATRSFVVQRQTGLLPLRLAG